MNVKKITKTARQLREGDRILIEAAGMEPFEATLIAHLGWGLVHGVWIIKCRRDDGTEFTYDLRGDSPVTVVDVETLDAAVTK